MKIRLLILAFLSAPAALLAQPYDTKAEIMADIAKAGGKYYAYEMVPQQMTAAPAGYKPFYISHMGRHGSRYALGNKVYSDLYVFFSKADSAGVLTAEGKALKRRYDAFYKLVAYREGELTRKGQEQHRFIASRMYADFPEVFEGKTAGSAISTSSHRVLVSMHSFLDEIKSLDPDFSCEVDYGRIYLPVLMPNSYDSPQRVHSVRLPKDVRRQQSGFEKASYDYDGITRRWFTDVDFVRKNFKGRRNLIRNLNVVIMDISSLDNPGPDNFMDVFSSEELYGIWRAGNFRDYLRYGRAPQVDNSVVKAMAVCAEDFISKAEEDFRSGLALRLRFSHDVAMMPLMAYLKVNGFGAEISDPDEVEKWFRNFEIPMACNFQLVFFRNAKGNIIIKPLLNGKEATLPISQAAPSFYSWKDFKAYCLGLQKEAEGK